jgi:hypothetical protein
MEEKYRKYIAGAGLIIIVGGSLLDHDQINLGLVQVIRIHEDHISEEPSYQYTRTQYPTTSIVSGSTTTTSTAP